MLDNDKMIDAWIAPANPRNWGDPLEAIKRGDIKGETLERHSLFHSAGIGGFNIMCMCIWK
jgi:hypothetical protein